jgi:hypothetical protein
MGTTGARRFQLCTIEPTIDITDDQTGGSKGTLVLARYDETFIISWTPFNGSTMHHLSLLQQNESTEVPDSWVFNSAFKQECGHIRWMQLHPNRSLTIYNTETQNRRFLFEEAEFISVIELVEQLLINAIVVPSPDMEYCLHFYKRCHRGVYPYTPPHIQLSYDPSTELVPFWDCLHSFFLTLIIHFDQSDTLPKDPQFPLAEAARAAHARVLAQFDASLCGLPTYETITTAEWPSLFDGDGRLIDPELFRKRLFHAGISREIRDKALPFVFGVYDAGSSLAERAALDVQLSSEFTLLVEQVDSYTEAQIESNHRIAAAFRVIKHDVSRTDRQLPAFKNASGDGLTMVTRLLKTYCIFNPPIGYLQGMNDLFVPILLAFLPDWDEETGKPVDAAKAPIDYHPFLPTIFWCFDAMLRNIDHLKLLQSVTEQCQKLAESVFQIMMKVSPLAAIWMKRNSLKELLWCYSDFVLLFKRSFDDIWSVWLQLNCSPAAPHWLSYFVAALLVLGFDKLAQTKDVSITTMMDTFPKILKEIDIVKTGKTSLWLAEQVPPSALTRSEPEPVCNRGPFRFLETLWTGPSVTRGGQMEPQQSGV